MSKKSKNVARGVRYRTTRHARHSVGARQVLTRIALAVGGRAGQRLTGHLAMFTGRMTLLRLIRTLPEPAVATPRVLGVDDFALRRGHVYATILIDMETHTPVDVLADRTADTLATWLRAHPGVEIICRDRAGAYAEGASTGAPNAVQVADRFHLWRNLGEAVEKDIVAHRGDLREPAPEPAAPPQPEPATTAPSQPAEPRLVTRTRERYTAVQQLLAAGASRARVSRELGLDPHTVRRFADAASIDDLLVHDHLTFGYGTSGPWSTAVDVHTSGFGVCRDYTHLAISFCRALNIPARYDFGYLPDMDVPPDPAPMDFAAWMEVWLGDRWWTFDPRSNRRRKGRILIGRGRDASDVAMVTTFGAPLLESMSVHAAEVPA